MSRDDILDITIAIVRDKDAREARRFVAQEALVASNAELVAAQKARFSGDFSGDCDARVDAAWMAWRVAAKALAAVG